MVKFKGSSSNTKIPQWLLTIQENSWEAELLLSAVMLFGLIQTPIYLDTWTKQIFLWESSILTNIFQGVIGGIKILRVGFILHLVVRALWIAQVGFSYVYPKGIRVDKLNFKGRFRSELSKTDSTVSSILKLEKVASMIFAISFSLFGLLLGMLFFVSPIMLISIINNSREVGGNLEMGFVIFCLFYLLLSLPVFIDFVTNGWLRRGNRRAKFFYPISYFYRIMTLSFLYKKTLLTIISNVNGYKRYLVTIGIVFLVSLMDNPSEWILEYKTDFYTENMKKDYLQKANYETLRDEEDLLIATIPAEVIETNVLPLFLKNQTYFKTLKTEAEKVKEDSARKNFRIQNNLNNKDLARKAHDLNKQVIVYIDDQIQKELNWQVNIHPKAYARGFTSFIPLDSLSNSGHRLKVFYKDVKGKEQASDSLIANIYFYKSVK